jgi:putative endopeptidase
MASARRSLPLVVLAACSAPAKPPAPAPVAPSAPPAATPAAAPAPAPAPTPATPSVKVTLADVGLEASSIDRTADPCVDFYQFACGGWLQSNQIPADRARWARFTEIDEKNNAELKTMLEEDAKPTAADATAKKLGDYFSSCMDQAAIDKAGLAPIKPLLDKTTRVKDVRSWQAAVAELHKVGIPVVFETSAGADNKDSLNNVTELDSEGLGLPDRDYYLNPEFKAKLDAYRGHVSKMLALAGTPAAKADAAADDVIAIETELAKVTKTRVDKRDPDKAYNPTDAKTLAGNVKSIDWKAYWKTLDMTPSAKIIVGTPAYFAAIDGLRAKFKWPQWSSYFTYHLVQESAFALPKAFDDEAFELEKVLTGVEKRERYKRCIESTETSLGELLGQQYAAKYFPPSSKQTATQLVDAIVRSMGDELSTLDWMSPDTRKIALAKLAKVVRMVGYPDKWRSYDFDVKRDDFAGNLMRASAFEAHRVRAKSGKPVDRSEWHMNSYTVNAYYNPTANNTALPAGILQAPFFGQDRSIAANFGGIGMVIGHELTHGFDDQGAKFDGDGNLKNWWSDADRAKFEAKGKCVADQYSTFEASKGGFVNGRLTLGEDIADLGGVKMAFHAYRELRKDAAKTYVADGFTEDQQFFIAAGQAWCSKDRPDEIQRRLTVDPHAPPKFRVYGALRNLAEFATAFQCAPGTPMRPAQTCSVW